MLLANWFDATLLRNDLALFMGNEISTLEWTPHFQQVDLILNGQYRGIYQLGEKEIIAKKRVNVGDNCVLMEIDIRAAEEGDARYFSVNHIENVVNIKDPDVEYNDDLYNWARDYLTAADDALFSDNFANPENGWQKYIDINSFVDWYIINEIAKNVDGNFFSSCYMNLKPGGKLKMGPLWDFDMSFGAYVGGGEKQSIVNNPEGFYIKDVMWFDRLFQDPVFVEKVQERFNIYYSNKQVILDHIDAQASKLINKVVEDNKLWGTITSTTATEDNVQSAYQAKVDALKTWLSTRLKWMNTVISGL